MKRNLLAVLVIFLMCIAFMLVSCNAGDYGNGDGTEKPGNNGTEVSGGSTESSQDKDNVHTVAFITNCGDEIEPVLVENGKKVAEPDEITRLGYTFDGWYLGKEKWSFVGYVVTEDITLAAKWIANENTVMFNANGGVGTMEGFKMVTDSVACLPNNTYTRAGYHFVGWSTTQGGEVKYDDGAEYTMGTDSSYTLYAVWEANSNTVVFDANGATSGEMDLLTVKSDESARLPINLFFRRGYTFKGWATAFGGGVEYTDGAEFVMGTDSSYTLYAVWEAKENTLVLKGNGAEGEMADVTIKSDETVKLPINTYTIDGYHFAGWSKSSYGKVEYADGGDYTMGTDSSYTLYAVWEANENALVFDGNGATGGIMENMTIKSDETAALSKCAFVKIGYAFIGWSTTQGGEVAYTDGAQYKMGLLPSYTLYAIWEANDNNIVFDPNGATSGSTAGLSAKTGESVTLTKNGFIRDGYIFKGWATTPYGIVKYADGDEYTMGTEASYTLYAVWEANIYTITYEKNGGTGELKETFTVNDLPLTLKDLNNKTNYLFNYWYKESDFSGKPVLKITEIGNVTLYAEYVEGTDGLKLSATTNGYEVYDYTGTATEVVIPRLYKGKKITSIGGYAFENCKSLTSITIPEGVTSIGERAFRDCTSLTSITIPEGVTNIGNYAFYNCTSLTSVTIPDSVTSIGNYVFYNCTSLTSITIPKGVTSIGNYVFYNCTSLKSITIPEGVTSIGDNAFENCSSLASLVIPNSVMTIGRRAFSRCYFLVSVVLGEKVTGIGDLAFDFCDKLVEICNLSKINLTKGTDDYGHLSKYALNIYKPGSGEKKTFTTDDGFIFYADGETRYLMGYAGDDDCIDLPTSCNGAGYEIHKWAFYKQTSILLLTIPKCVTKIGTDAFRDCKKTLVILCEAESKPSAWSNSWNSGSQVMYGYKYKEVTYTFVVDGAIEMVSNASWIKLPKIEREGYHFYGWSESDDFSTGTKTGVYYNEKDVTLYAKLVPVAELKQSEGLAIVNGYVTGIGTCTDDIIYIDMPIAEHAFANCLTIKAVIFGEGVTEIGYQAFYRCDNLQTAIFVNPSQDTSKIDNDCFSYTWNDSGFCVYIPKGSLDDYIAIGGYFNSSVISRGQYKEYDSLEEVLNSIQ